MNDDTIKELKRIDRAIRRLQNTKYAEEDRYQALLDSPLVKEFMALQADRKKFEVERSDKYVSLKGAYTERIKENCKHPLYALVRKDRYTDPYEGCGTDLYYLCVECDDFSYDARKCRLFDYPPKHVLDLTQLGKNYFDIGSLFHRIQQEYRLLSKEYSEESVVLYLKHKYGKDYQKVQGMIDEVGEKKTQKILQILKKR